MNRNEYKKVLIDLRNNYIDYKNDLEDQITSSLSKSFEKQLQYLDKATFSLIFNNNVILSNIGRFMAYKLFKKKTNKELLNITMEYTNEYDKICKEKKRATTELNKINNALDFVNSVSDEQLVKYLSYKRN